MTTNETKAETMTSTSSNHAVDTVPEKTRVNETSDQEYPSTGRVVLIMASLYITIFLTALVSSSS